MERRSFGIVVFRNGTEENGKLIRVESDSMDVLLTLIRKTLETKRIKEFESSGILRLFSFHGSDISKIEQLRDGDVIYVSAGEGFLHQGKKRGDPDQELVKLNFAGRTYYASKQTLRLSPPKAIITLANTPEMNSQESGVTLNLDSDSARQVQHLLGKKEVSTAPSLIRQDKLGRINELPLEILEKVLMDLPTSDLLRCRRTNSLWRDLLTPLCRQRHVALQSVKHPQSELEQGYVLDLFKNSRTIPWSSHTFSDCPRQFNFQHQLLRLYGPQLLHVQIHGSFEYILRTVRMTPWITHLRITLGKDVFTQSTKKLKSSIQKHHPLLLAALTHLEIELVEDSVMEFLEFLSHTSRLPALKFFKTRLQLNTVGAAKKVANLLSKFPLVSIDIQFLPATALTFRAFTAMGALRAQALRLHLEEPPVGDLFHFTPVENLLSSCAGSLETLSLDCISDVFCGASTVNIRNFPKLPNLTTLNFTYIYHGVDYMHTGFLANFFRNITACHFPNLFKVVIRESCHVRRYGLASAIFSTSENVQFNTVRELETEVDSLPEDCWSGIFPNIEKFVGHVCESDLIRIFRNLTKLKHLSLNVAAR